MDKFNYNSILSSVNENFTEQKGLENGGKSFLLFHAKMSIVNIAPKNLDDSLRAERKITFMFFSIKWLGVRRSEY